MAPKRKINTKTKLKPDKGCKFLKSVPKGCYFTTPSGLMGKVISKNDGSILCKFIKTPYRDGVDIRYWIGDRRISPDTNVKQIRRQDA